MLAAANGRERVKNLAVVLAILALVLAAGRAADADSHPSEDFDRLAEPIDRPWRHYAPRMLDRETSELFCIGGRSMPRLPGRAREAAE